jgi:protein-S-isoprenylcysteine O-methyltransferase Ste14
MTTRSTDRQPIAAAWAVALVCYALALLGAGALAALVLALGLGLWETALVPLPVSPWVVNAAWLAAFGVQHSLMAREGFKRRWTRLVPADLERALYVGLSGLLLVGLVLTWQPLPGGPLWRGPGWLAVVPLAAGAGLVLVNLRFDPAQFFGLRQALGRGPAPDVLLVVGPYRYVRHPLMTCLLVFLWAQPVMPPALAFLSGGLTAYVAVGLVFEERDLLARFGDAYRAYRRRVPALVPWRRPAPPATHPVVEGTGRA